MNAPLLLCFVVGLSLLVMSACAQDAPLTLRTDRPGNLFAHDAPVVIHVEAPDHETVSWRLSWLDTRLDPRPFGGPPASRSRDLALTDGRGEIRIFDRDRGYYELTCEAGDHRATLAFGIITDRSEDDPPDGRLNVDGATAWLEREGRHEALAQMLRMAGIGWARERFSWGQTEPERGVVDWRQYNVVADVFTQQGIRVYQIFHDTPAWTREGQGDTRNPDDLRDVYAFARRMAEHYRGRVRAWEVWNEPDIGFWPDLGDTFAGVQKAAYLGFKAGDPDLPVLLASLCRGYGAFAESLFEAGIAEYYDIFNWHTYSRPQDYPAILQGYTDMLLRHDCADRPIWLTEAGIRLVATEPDGELNADDERRQAEFVPKSFAWSLAAGTDNHFFFVYPYYLERGVQFGALRKDLSPRPAFIAIAAAAEFFGESTYLGEWRFDENVTGATGHAFDTDDGRLLVVWSERLQRVTLPVGAERVEVADMLGRRQTRDAPGGALTLLVGETPVYVRGPGETALQHIALQARPPGRLPANDPCPVVIRAQAQVETLDKDRNAYPIGPEPFDYTIEVCNFGEADAAGRVWLEAPEGWTCEPAEMQVSLEPMGRALERVVVTPSVPFRGAAKLWVRGDFGDLRPAPCISYFTADIARITPAETLDLELGDPARWRANISGNGRMEVRAGEDGAVRFDIMFQRAGDRWAYPRVEFDPPVDWSDYDGIAFDYRCHGDDTRTTVRLQVIEQGGPHYLTAGGRPARGEWQQVASMFEDLTWGSFSPPDPNGRLDLDAIAGLMIGLNTPHDEVWLEVRNVRLVRLEP